MSTNQPPAPKPLPGAQASLEIEDRAELAEQRAAALARQPRTLKDLLRGDDFQKAVAEVAPQVMRPTRFVRAALTSLLRVPLLAEASRESFFKAMLDCAFYGIEPDGRRAHLIPYKNNKMCRCGHPNDQHRGQNCAHCDCKQRQVMIECQLIIDYKGLAELVRRSGDVSFIHADVVYENDFWECSYGTGGQLVHKPNLEDRGSKRLCYYSFVKLKDGSEDFMLMNLKEVQAIRARSKSPDAGPWQTDFDEMGKKTVFRRHSKWLPLSPEARVYIDRSDPDAVETGGAADASSTWSEMLEAPPESPQRLSARERVLNQPSFAEEAEPEAPTAEAEDDNVPLPPAARGKA